MEKAELAEQEQLKEFILSEYQKGNIVVSGWEGLQVWKLDEIMNQSIEGILYDCNRDAGTILTWLNDPKWVNDYALMTICDKLWYENKDLKEKLAQQDSL